MQKDLKTINFPGKNPNNIYMEADYTELHNELKSAGFLTRDSSFLATLGKLKEIALADISVVLSGASGTGKNLIAHFIHHQSNRKEGPFITVDVSCLSSHLIESELFGHEKGAFTGAVSRHTGAFELAHRGTLFLDEIGDLPLVLQKKLLRAIEARSIKPVGAEREISVDFRIIAATNKNLKKMVREKKFRKDLFFRLHESSVQLSRLRERKGDISLLVRHFISTFNQEFGKKVMSISTIALTYLENYMWPGNVRELKNVIKSAVASTSRDALWIEDLPLHFYQASDDMLEELPFKDPLISLDEMEKSYVQHVLKRNNWNKSKASRILKISRPKLDRMIHRYGFSSGRG